MPPAKKPKTEPIKAVSLPAGFLKNLPMKTLGKKLKKSRLKICKEARLLEASTKKQQKEDEIITKYLKSKEESKNDLNMKSPGK